MHDLPFPLGSPSEAGPLCPASELRNRISAPDLALDARLADVYGDGPNILADRARAVLATLDRFLEAFGDRPCAVYRAPARLSLNPHCDHQGAWVPYGLHVRELLSVVAPAEDDRVELVNVDPSFAPHLAFSAGEEIRRDRAAWDQSWFRYIEADGVRQSVAENLDPKSRIAGRRATVNYLRGGVLRMRHLLPDAALPGLRLALNGNIAQGGGQSSSSALVVTAALASAQFAGLKLDRKKLAEHCGEAEWYVGTRGGSGDHAAILLGSRAGLTHLCFRAPFGIRGVRLSSFPAGYQLIVANSQTRSEKSAEERVMFNRGIFAYRFAFLALRDAMRNNGFRRELVAETACLGDIHSGRIPQPELYRLICALPEHAAPAELAARFPEAYSTAARGCFGTDDIDRLPAEIPLRGAAVFGLGRVDRGLAMPDLLDRGDETAMAELGRLMSITHDGDRLYRDGTSYNDNRTRLSDEHLARNASVPLREEPGFYGASIAELDRMVDVALRVDGVLGAGLMGAGGGGYVLMLARAGALARVREALVREYYQPLGKEPDVEAWHPTAAACRLL